MGAAVLPRISEISPEVRGKDGAPNRLPDLPACPGLGETRSTRRWKWDDTLDRLRERGPRAGGNEWDGEAPTWQAWASSSSQLRRASLGETKTTTWTRQRGHAHAPTAKDDKDKPRESESWQSWSLTDTKSEVAPGQYTG